MPSAASQRRRRDDLRRVIGRPRFPVLRQAVRPGHDDLDDRGVRAQAFPLARSAYVIDRDLTSLSNALDELLLQNDSKADQRKATRNHYLGPFPPQSYADAFVNAARQVVLKENTSPSPRRMLPPSARKAVPRSQPLRARMLRTPSAAARRMSARSPARVTTRRTDLALPSGQQSSPSSFRAVCTKVLA